MDYTNGLTLPLVGEADWAIINTTIGKFYEGFWQLYSRSQADFASLLQLFGLTSFNLHGKSLFITKETEKALKLLLQTAESRFSSPQARKDFYTQLLKNPSGDESFDEAVRILAEEDSTLHD